jgi:RNA polymerase sigma factor (sigma-70 family)
MASTLTRQLRKTVLSWDGAGLTDDHLIACFIEHKDEDAFAALVRRHGPLVWGVCRRHLNHHDAEDAFQATFLVLARKVGSIVSRPMVANWLYGVARTTAVRAKVLAAKRRAKERQVAELPEPEAVLQEPDPRRELLDQELSRLPDKYRAPIVLCDLEDRSIKEAARQLGWPLGTVAGRLARGRKLLAKRIASRGVVLSAGSLAAVVSQNRASVGVSAALVGLTVKAASLMAAGKVALAEVVPVRVTALMEGVMKAMLLTKLRTIAAVLLVVAGVGIGGGWLARPATVAAQTDPVPDAKGTPDAKPSQSEYKSVFIKTLGVVGGHFEYISYANQYDGRIEARTVAVDPARMTRLAYVNLSCQDGTCSVTVRIDKVRTAGDKSEVIGRDADLERVLLKELNAQQIPEGTQGKRSTGAGAKATSERTFLTPFVDGGPVDKQEEVVQKEFRTAKFYHRTGHIGAAYFYYEKVARSGDRTFAPMAREIMADLDKRYGSQASGPAATEPPAETLDGEWMGRVDGVAVTLVFGPKDSVLLISGDGGWARGSYSVDLEQHPHHLNLHWKEPAGKFKAEKVQAILEFEESGRLRIELPYNDTQRPQKFTAASVVLVKDYRLPSGERGYPPAEAEKTPPQPPPKAIDQAPGTTEKKPERVGQVIIVGNTKTATSVILKKIPLRPGEVLDYEALRTAERNLAAFNATITVENSDNSEFKDVVVTVNEK